MKPFPTQTEASPPAMPSARRWLAVGLVAFGLALGGRFALASLLPPVGFPFLTFFPAVILATLFGGLWAGLLTAGLSVAAAWFFFIPPPLSFAINSLPEIIALVVFSAVLLVDCVVIHVMTTSLASVRAERARSAALAGELALRLEELRAVHEEGEAVRTRLAASEAGLQALNRDLQARVEAEVAAREAAQARAAHAERLQALGRLAGGIAHDFNNVLKAVGTAATLIGRRPEDPATIRRLTRLVAEATRRGAAVTARLLAFARRGDLRAEAVEPGPLLEGLRDMLAPTLGSGIAVRVQAPPALPAMLVDRAQLETVLVNLAANARDAMPEGGRLTLSAAAEAVAGPHPAGLRPGAYLRLAVADTGIGIAPEVMARVTEPFFTTKPPGHGTGLGLSMAHGFVAQSGGGLLVESEPGLGTTVTLWLPRAEAAPATAPPPPPPAPDAALRGCRLLLVDDELPVRETMAAALRDLGCEVETAESGEAALRRLLGPLRIDALLTDLSMPGMNGLALIRAARTRHPGLPALLLTGFAGDLPEGAGEAGVALLRKPVGLSELAARLAPLVEARAPLAATPEA